MVTLILQPDAVVLPDSLAAGAQVAITDGVVEDVGVHLAREAETIAGTLLPGFVDLQVNGAGGHGVDAGDREALDHIARIVAARGAAAFLPTVITAPMDDLTRQVAAVADWIEGERDPAGATPLGIHVEGPFLLSAGAHDPGALCDPDPDRVDAVLQAGRGHVRLVTLAPSREGAAAAVAQFRAAGVTVALGHGAGTEGITACVAAGATMATHLYNAMGPFDHRNPGMAFTILDDRTLACTLIVDGVHVHEVALRHAFRILGVRRFVLITDCVSAMGMPDGEYTLGGASVVLRDGSVRTKDGTLAGAALTMHDAAANFLRMIPEAGPWSLAQVAAVNPARLIGAREFGRIAPGRRARFSLLGADGSLQTVDHSEPKMR